MTYLVRSLSGIMSLKIGASFMKERDFQWLSFCVTKHESAFNPDAKSRCGAKGLMQLMDKTGRELWQEIGSVKEYAPYDPDINRMLGSRYLRRLIIKFHGNIRVAVAAYNWGQSNVDKALDNGWQNATLEQARDSDEFNLIRSRLPKETKVYVSKVWEDYQRGSPI